MSKQPVLLSLIDDPMGKLPGVTNFRIVQAEQEFVNRVNDYVLKGRTIYKLMDEFPTIFNGIVEHERQFNQGQRFDGVVLRNRNINTCCLYYMMQKLKEAGYGLAFSEQKRLKPGSDIFIPSYVITFDFK